MTKPTLSARIRNCQNRIRATTNELTVLLGDATHIGLAPFRLAEIRAAMHDTQHAWTELDVVALALELTPAHRKP